MYNAKARQTMRQAEEQIRKTHSGKGVTARGVAAPSPIPRQSAVRVPLGKRK
jgi:hypothetical protein